MLLPLALGVGALRARVAASSAATRSSWSILALMPIAVVTGVEAAFYTPGTPADRRIRSLRVPGDRSARGARRWRLHAFGRRRMLYAGAGLLVAMLASATPRSC